MRWAVDLILEFVNGQSYENIEFAGFYWTHEAMNENEDDCELINTVADYTHEKGYELFWIPFYKASGFDAWHAYGFDIACMQPNYAFDANVGAGQLTNCAIMAKRLGMCVEMELMGATLTDKTYFDKYMGYLTEGVTQGYMTETVHIYYQDILAYYNACYAEDDMARLVYTYTYDFIKGRLNTAPEREPGQPSVRRGGQAAERDVQRERFDGAYLPRRDLARKRQRHAHAPTANSPIIRRTALRAPTASHTSSATTSAKAQRPP